MWVVKLGGSLAQAQSSVLGDWLTVLVRHGGGRVVIVPGGGVFADQVREMQRRWRFSDLVAHRMALRAIEQFGELMTGLEPALALSPSVEAIRHQLRCRRVAVWLPYAMAVDEQAIRASWDVSSDSLAAWLASRLGAEHLVLVKSVPPVKRRIAATELSKRGIVDVAFADYLSPQLKVWWLHAPDYLNMAEILADRALPPTRVLAEPDHGSQVQPDADDG